MSKSGVRGRKSGVREAKFENRNSKIGKSSNDLRVSDFEFRISNSEPRLRTSHHGLRVLIIGYGNPLRGDDGFGWHAAQALSRTLRGRGIDVVTCHQLTPELSEQLSRCDLAVFIDADCQGTPGRIHRRIVRPHAPGPCGFTHSSTPSGLLANAQNLYGARPRGVAITVSAKTFAFGETLSPVVTAALPKVVDQVRRLVRAGRTESAARTTTRSPKRCGK